MLRGPLQVLHCFTLSGFLSFQCFFLLCFSLVFSGFPGFFSKACSPVGPARDGIRPRLQLVKDLLTVKLTVKDLLTKLLLTTPAPAANHHPPTLQPKYGTFKFWISWGARLQNSLQV